MKDVHFLTVPGLASSGPKHWQTLWEKQYPQQFMRVEQEDWDMPVRADWVRSLNEYIAQLSKPTILVAHSLGCLTVVHWAQRYHSPWIKGALLVAPADAEQQRRLSFVVDFAPIPLQQLPFPSIVIASTNDIYMTIQRSEQMAQAWGSEFTNAGEKGHINASSNLDDWQEGKEVLHGFVSNLLISV